MRPGVFLKRAFALVLCVALFAGNIGYLKAQNDENNNDQEGVQTADQLVEETEDQDPETYASHVDMSGFKANFFKYDLEKINAVNEAVYNADKDSYLGKLTFTSTGSHKDSWSSNHYNGVYQGLVKESLSDTGAIQFNYAAGDLFGGAAADTGITDSSMDVTFPMNYNAADGYYEYDSDVNSMTLSGDVASMGDGNGGFWPFGKKKITFGMNFSTDFYTTYTGTVDNTGNSDDMIFDFSGDDDVWVFVDGKLVIDLGGVHPAIGANINLRTGDVAYYAKAAEATATVFKAGIGGSYNVYSNGVLNRDNILNAGKHTLQIFYLERGGSKSNCKIRFNLPQVPCENILQVTNKVSTTVNGQQVTDDTAFGYQIKKDGAPLGNYNYEYIDGAGKHQTAVTDANGMFQLKNSETALFQKPEDGTYTVDEALQNYYNSAYVAQVKIGNEVKENFSGSMTGTTGSVLSATLTLSPNYNAVGNYRIDFENVRVVNYTMQTTKTAKLKDWKQRTYNINLGVYHTTNDDAYAIAPQGTVVDYIDDRFVPVKEDGMIAKAGDVIADGTVGYEENTDRYFVLWNAQEIHYGSAEAPSWTKTFTVAARENYVGGNKITTNGPESGVTVGGETILFPQPEVNVRISWSAENEEDTIFLGETLQNYATADKLNKVSGAKSGLDTRDVKVTTTWKDEKGSVLPGEIVSQLQPLSPQADTWYQADTVVEPLKLDLDIYTIQTAEAMKNEDGVSYTASMQTAEDTKATNVTSTGKYTIHVVEGELTIIKNFDLEYLNNIGYTQEEKDAVAAAQSVVFTINRYAPEDTACTGEILDTYKAVITYDARTGEYTGSVKVTGLSLGNYKVTEDTKWSWKYLLEATTDTYVDPDGILFIGHKADTYQTENKYFGEKGTPDGTIGYASVTFTNKLDLTKEWLSDTIHALNVFK